jgi:hypothetical protein
LSEPSTLRFVVGTIDGLDELRSALRDLRARGVVLDSFNCLALQRLFVGKTVVDPDQRLVDVKLLSFAEATEAMVCTSGPLTDCLIQRIRSGSRTLADALGFWLIARHAAHIEDAVAAGKIVFWVLVSDADDERRAFQALLAHSSSAVGVHNFVLPGAN